MDLYAILEKKWAQLLYTIAMTVGLILLQRRDLRFVDAVQVENGMAVFHNVTAVCCIIVSIAMHKISHSS